VLEVGCSQANASLLLAEQGYRCIGLDIRPEALGYASSKHTDGRFYPVSGSAGLDTENDSAETGTWFNRA